MNKLVRRNIIDTVNSLIVNHSYCSLCKKKNCNKSCAYFGDKGLVLKFLDEAMYLLLNWEYENWKTLDFQYKYVVEYDRFQDEYKTFELLSEHEKQCYPERDRLMKEKKEYEVHFMVINEKVREGGYYRSDEILQEIMKLRRRRKSEQF